VNTTPESLDLIRLLVELETLGGNATMEVSSHALALGRCVWFALPYAVFTNLTRDHLDFHVTMEDYFAAKRQLFQGAGQRLAAAPQSGTTSTQHASSLRPRRNYSGTAWAKTLPCAPGVFHRICKGCASR
jgi:UDP-N-acetylmuramoylalanine-D-glutamate ligase